MPFGEKPPTPEKPSFEQRCRALFDEKFALKKKLILGRDTLSEEELEALNLDEEGFIDRTLQLAATASDDDLKILAHYFAQDEQRDQWMYEQRLGGARGAHEVFQKITAGWFKEDHLKRAQECREEGQKKFPSK